MANRLEENRRNAAGVSFKFNPQSSSAHGGQAPGGPSSLTESRFTKKLKQTPFPSEKTTGRYDNKPTVSGAYRHSIARESLLSIDRNFLDNPAQVARYCREIFNYYLSEEVG